MSESESESESERESESESERERLEVFSYQLWLGDELCLNNRIRKILMF